MLINCPECKSQVSTAAKQCPACGHPIRSVLFREYVRFRWNKRKIDKENYRRQNPKNNSTADIIISFLCIVMIITFTFALIFASV